ncbi:MAG: glutamate 5-kinase [Candidatus Magasanikbacteria bacterium RIFCSPHIGHO2_02_FULL_47_14]|uniref:Glutamate 5-kinase n=1 Tax=Candidatus Magasanikbacteria bacterium RIFCSPHIGHO2_02_FULL_47_14 TaxID=1798680 RepID=A0A1F6MB72_9BACT|nr:MAG: glutamate 5-kinase [Candidatus Magasanikbacteria bacterium RIFCSPHIGHO2_02_FULL_47_14]
MPRERIVIKIGTNVITKDTGLLDIDHMRHIVADIATVIRGGAEVILVSSGAMGAGRGIVALDEKEDPVVRRQTLAAVGQVALMGTYASLFRPHAIVPAQVLATKEDFRDRTHYMNMKNCFSSLLRQGVIPIVNENDVVSVTELMFTENDELAGLVSSMMNAERLIILTSVDGVYSGDPESPDAHIIETIAPQDISWQKSIAPTKSSFGRGGMKTKCAVAQKLATLGIRTHVVNGEKQHAIREVVAGKNIGTTFLPERQRSNIKKRIAYAYGQEKGTVYIKKDAREILTSKQKTCSLLPVGITKIEGAFEKGDIIQIKDEKNQRLGLGVAEYPADTARKYIGVKGKKPLVHYDYLYIEK